MNRSLLLIYAFCLGALHLGLVSRAVEKSGTSDAVPARTSTTNLQQVTSYPPAARKKTVPAKVVLTPSKLGASSQSAARTEPAGAARPAEDQQLQRLVRRVLADDPRTRPLAAQARVENDVAILAGEASTETMRESAEQYVHRIPGLKRVDDRIVLRPTLDMQIVQRLHEAFSQDPLIDDAAVGVTVVGAKVFLCGEVSSPEAVSRAYEIAAGIPGVKAVSNGLQATAGARRPATPAWQAKRPYTIPTYRTPYR